MVLFSRTWQPDWSAGKNPDKEAKCRKFPTPVHGADPWFDDMDEAAEICNGNHDGRICPMRHECLLTALVNNELDGTWGGLRPEQRRFLRRFVPAPEWAFDQAPPLAEVLELMPPRKRKKRKLPPPPEQAAA